MSENILRHVSYSIHKFTQICKKFAAFARKIVYVYCSEIITKTNLGVNFLQICVNIQKFWNNVMSNDGLIIEYKDLSHIHLAAPKFYFIFDPTFSVKIN